MEPETKKELYTEVYNNKGIMDKVEYVYEENDNTEYKIIVDYNEINKKLNKGEIKYFNELFSIDPKCIVIKDKDGNIINDNEKFNNFKIIKECGKYQMQTRLKGKSNELDDENRMEGGTTGLQNLLILSGLESLESLKRIRFEIVQNNPNWPANIYKDAKELLKSYGLTISNPSEDSNLVSIFDDNLQEVNYITTNAITTTKDHAVNITIDLKKIRETIEKGETPDNIDFLYGYDTSRFAGDPGEGKNILGNLTNNCKFYNHNQQELGSCWYNASCSTLTAAENPDIIDRIRNKEIKPILFDDRYIKESTQINDFEILQMKRLQKLAENLEVERLGFKPENKELTSKNNRPRMIRQIVNSDMREKLKELTREWLKKNGWLIKQNAKLGTYNSLRILTGEAKKMKDLLNERGIRKANEEIASELQLEIGTNALDKV